MQDVMDKAAIDRAIDSMNPVDPMSYKPVLTAYNVLRHTNARIEHILVVGDGEAEDSYYRSSLRCSRAPVSCRQA